MRGWLIAFPRLSAALIVRRMNDFDQGLFGGRGGLLGGDRGLFGDRGLLGSFSPFAGGRDFPLLGGGFGDDRMGMGGGGRDQGLMLGPGDEFEDTSDVLALPSPLDLMRPVTGGLQQLPTLRMDIEEKPDKYEVTAEVPGFRKEDLHVRVENGCLVIDAKHAEEKKRDDPNRRFLRTERVVQSARRMIRLSTDTDQTPGKVKARYADGILKVRASESRRTEAREMRSLECSSWLCFCNCLYSSDRSSQGRREQAHGSC